ncbi:MAG TPA: EthD family reductase [Stellaceae bacterium]|nr:EthD family reductase [Stellaceae bacterium]
MAKAYFAVRAEVPEADRARFDQWYQTDHLPWALRVFGARRAWRCWSKSDPQNEFNVHVAFYEFDSVEAAEAATRSDAIKPLVEDFDRVWQNRVTRRRAVLDVVQEIEA